MTQQQQMGDQDFVIAAKVLSVVQKTRRDGTIIPNAWQVNLGEVTVERQPLGVAQVPNKLSYWSHDQQGVPIPSFQVLKSLEGTGQLARLYGYVQTSSNYGRTTTYWNGQNVEPASGAVQPAQPQAAGGAIQQQARQYNDAERAYFDLCDALPVAKAHLIESKWALATVLQTLVAPGIEGDKIDPQKPLPAWVASKSIEVITMARTLAVEMAGRDMQDAEFQRGQEGSSLQSNDGQQQPQAQPEAAQV